MKEGGLEMFELKTRLISYLGMLGLESNRLQQDGSISVFYGFGTLLLELFPQIVVISNVSDT